MRIVIATAALLAIQAPSAPPASEPAFVDGLAQPVFAGQPVIRHNVWVEVPNLDTDRDGVNDRIRLQVSRPDATERGTPAAGRVGRQSLLRRHAAVPPT